MANLFSGMFGRGGRLSGSTRGYDAHTPQAKAPKIRPVDPKSVESELSPDEIEQVQYVPTEEEKELIRLVEDRFTAANNNRRWHEGPWFESLAMYLGNQWLSWVTPGAGTGGMLRSMRDPRKPHKVYATRNKIRPKIKKLLARALKTKPDAGVAPQTHSPLDMAAAAEARALLQHFDNKFDRQIQVKRLCRYALTTSTAFLKIYYDAFLDAPVPKFGPDGSIIGSSMADVGDINELIVPIFEMYIDPKARAWEEVGWLIHAKTRSLEYIQQRYPEFGKFVKGDAGEGASGYVESRLAAVVGEYVRGSEPGNSKKAAIVKEMWEPPSPRYENGRLLTVANGVLLRGSSPEDRDWPYQGPGGDDNVYPFIPLPFEDGQSTLYALNAVQDLISPQRSYNEGISRVIEHRKTAWGKIFCAKGTEIGADAFDSATPNEIIYYTQGPTPPQHVPCPPFPQFLIELLKIDQGDMEDISGVHEVSDGNVPSGVTAGNAIALLQESDTTQMEDFISNIETFHRRRAEWEIALAAQFYREPRLIGVSQTKTQATAPLQAGRNGPLAPNPGGTGPGGSADGTVQGSQGDGPGVPGVGGAQMGQPGAGQSGPGIPQAVPQGGPWPENGLPVGQPPQVGGGNLPSPVMEARMFRALAAGGATRVIVTPGSALSKGTAAWNEQLAQMYKMGVFGPPGSPQATAMLLDQMEFAGSSVIVEAVMQAQQDALAAAQAAQPNPVLIQALQQQHAQQMAQMQAQMQAMQQQADQNHATMMAELDLRTKMTLADQAFQQKIALAGQEHTHEGNLLVADKTIPGVALTGKMDPQAIVDAEQAAGYRGQLADAKAVNAPPKPASPAKASQGSGAAGAKP